MQTYIDEIPDYPNIQKIKKGAVLFVNFAMALLITFFIVRIVEFFYLAQKNDIPADYLTVGGEAVLFDLVFFLKIIPFLFIPFVIVYFCTTAKRSRFWFFGLTGSLIILIYILLVKYFATAMVPLGADLFGYSVAEIRQTLSGNARVDFLSVMLLLIPLISFWALLRFFYSHTYIKSVYAYAILIAGSVIAYLGVSSMPASASFKSDFSYNISLNKAAYFTEKSYGYFVNNESVPLIIEPEAVQPIKIAGLKPFNYINEEYPFLRTDETEDVLGNFFTIDSAQKPNIVFIQVEGLGRAFSGKNAYLESFTPFLDELADKGLYWENFLASQGRTFASLPSILGSLPFGEKGFSDLGEKMPKHISIMDILNHNGYLSKYYGGFEMEFDNQGLFMRNAGASLIVSSEDYNSNFKKASSWGFSDRDLMLKSIQTEAKNPQQPFFTFIETISMHTPYTVPNQANYIKLFEDRMVKLGFDISKKESYKQYKEIYSSIMYTDEALRFFFSEYAKLPSYKNTIFVITGDHRLPEIPMSTKIDRYHVPLIVYSPMLKRTASFKSVSSHLDITPSMVALLKKNYKISSPSAVTWVGSGLDTARTLRNIHQYPLKQTVSALHNYISGLHFIDQEQLFKVGENMDLEPVQNEEKSKQLLSQFNQYKARNNKFITELKLIPDSLYLKYKK